MFAQRIVRNIGWKSLGTLIEKSLRLLLMGLVARALAPAAYGQYNYALNLALLAVQMTDLGLGLFLAREIARDSAPTGRIVGHVFTLKAALGAGYLVLMCAMTWWHIGNTYLAWTLALAGLSSLCVTTIEAIYQIFRGVQRLELEARAASLHAALQLTLVGVGIVWWRHIHPIVSDPMSAMVLVSACMLVGNGIALVYAARLALSVARPEYGWSRAMLGRFGREVLPLGIAIVASLFYFKIDVLMLTALRGDVETGVYSVAYKLFENLSFVPNVLLAATFPALSQKIQVDPRAAVALHGLTLRLLIGAGLCAMAGLIALPYIGLQPLIIHVLGAGYARSIPVLVALAPSVLLTFVNYLETHMLVALGMVKAQMAVTLALVGVNVAANLMLIPRFGGVGAAIATAATELALFACCVPMVQYGLRKRILRAEALARPA